MLVVKRLPGACSSGTSRYRRQSLPDLAFVFERGACPCHAGHGPLRSCAQTDESETVIWHSGVACAAGVAGLSTRLSSMSRIYLPTTGSHDWQWLLASPGPTGSTAPRRWLWPMRGDAQDWPTRSTALDTSSRPPRPGVAAGPARTRCPAPRRRGRHRPICSSWPARPQAISSPSRSKGRRRSPSATRRWPSGAPQESPGRDSAWLSARLLGLPDDERLATIRYQLLHRTASAIIEARRFGGTHAVMLSTRSAPRTPGSRTSPCFARSTA